MTSDVIAAAAGLQTTVAGSAPDWTPWLVGSLDWTVTRLLCLFTLLVFDSLDLLTGSDRRLNLQLRKFTRNVTSSEFPTQCTLVSFFELRAFAAHCQLSDTCVHWRDSSFPLRCEICGYFFHSFCGYKKTEKNLRTLLNYGARFKDVMLRPRKTPIKHSCL